MFNLFKSDKKLCVTEKQKEVCKGCNVEPFASDLELKVGVSKNLSGNIWPVNGLRHKPENGTSGWYFWAGDYSEDPDFFEPMHLKHLVTKLPLMERFLALPPGWRFLIGENGHVDIWEDKNLLIT